MFVIVLLFATMNREVPVQKIIKAELVFKGIKNVSGEWQLLFTDRKYNGYVFSVPRSNTSPYIFYSTDADGSLKENEKVKGAWFLISYTTIKTDKTAEKIITQVKAIDASK